VHASAHAPAPPVSSRVLFLRLLLSFALVLASPPLDEDVLVLYAVDETADPAGLGDGGVGVISAKLTDVGLVPPFERWRGQVEKSPGRGPVLVQAELIDDHETPEQEEMNLLVVFRRGGLQRMDQHADAIPERLLLADRYLRFGVAEVVSLVEAGLL
jgi:hypothetical protein